MVRNCLGTKRYGDEMVWDEMTLVRNDLIPLRPQKVIKVVARSTVSPPGELCCCYQYLATYPAVDHWVREWSTCIGRGGGSMQWNLGRGTFMFGGEGGGGVINLVK